MDTVVEKPKVTSDVPDGYKHTEVGVIPEDWEVNKLEKFFSYISYGFTNPMPETDSGIFMITAADIKNGEIQHDSARYTSLWAYRNLLTPKSRPKVNDILLTKDGTLGRVALVKNENLCINQSVAVIRPNESISPLFLKYLLEAPYYQKKMIEDAGGSTIKHIYITRINLMDMAVPKRKKEQRAIAGALSDVDALIAELDALIEKKQQVKKGAMQQLLTGKKRLSGFSGAWEVKNLGDLLDYEQPPKYIVQTEIKDDNVGVPVLTANKSFILGYTPEKVGVFENIPVIIFDDFTTLTKYVDFRFKVKSSAIKILKATDEKVDLRFIYELMQILEFSTGDHKRYYISEYQHQVIKVPSIEEQKAIAQILSDMDAEIRSLEAKRNKYRQIKQGMMQELLTGKTRLV